MLRLAALNSNILFPAHKLFGLGMLLELSEPNFLIFRTRIVLPTLQDFCKN